MEKEYIIRRVKAKMNFMKKIKDLKKKVLKKNYKTLNEENAIAFTRDLGEEHYWKFDVPDKPKTSKRTYQGVSVIDVEISPEGSNSLGSEITVWFDPVLGKLHGDYKVSFTQHAKYKPKFQFTPLTEESALAYTKTIEGIEVDKSKKPKKIKEDGYPMIEVPITSGGHDYTFMVWYDPGYMGLYGEW